jgi:hypothetical protein
MACSAILSPCSSNFVCSRYTERTSFVIPSSSLQLCCFLTTIFFAGYQSNVFGLYRLLLLVVVGCRPHTQSRRWILRIKFSLLLFTRKFTGEVDVAAAEGGGFEGRSTYFPCLYSSCQPASSAAVCYRSMNPIHFPISVSYILLFVPCIELHAQISMLRLHKALSPRFFELVSYSIP